jgi:uncharacterized protein
LLCQIEITTELSYCIKLAYGGRNSNGKEGELAILVQESGKNDDLARLSFMLNSKGDIYIAGLQASPTPNFREIIAQASKACSGLSPKRMAMEALFSLAKQIGSKAILGVPDEQHFSRKKVTKYFSYNDYCSEFNVLRNECGGYVLPLRPIHKELNDVPTKRRAKYRRQHALLDAIHRDTLHALNLSVTSRKL